MAKISISPPPLDCIPTVANLAPCEHIAGNERFILKAFNLQSSFTTATQDRSLFDVTLDLEDGAPIGNEETLRQLFVQLLNSPENSMRQAGVRIHPISSPHCQRDLEVILQGAARNVRYITIPKVESPRDILWCRAMIQHYSRNINLAGPIAIHALIETNGALSKAREIARIEGVETLDFGLMDFISQLGGTIPADCMRSPGQFTNELIRSVKSELSFAALLGGKIASHNVSVNFRDLDQTLDDATRARREFGFMRMWSIHPDQIGAIIRGMTPSGSEVTEAREIIERACKAAWGPIEVAGRLHDRASFRYYWGVLCRAGEV
jgi:citrate lyase subunit beta/citryl-CoA lyase